MSGFDTVLLSDSLDLLVFEEKGSTDGVVSERRVSGNVDVVLLVVGDELGLLKERVTFDLVNSGSGSSSLSDSIDHLGVHVGDADGLDFLAVEQLDHSLPCVNKSGLLIDLGLVTVLGEEVLSEVSLRNEGNGPVDLNRRNTESGRFFSVRGGARGCSVTRRVRGNEQ